MLCDVDSRQSAKAAKLVTGKAPAIVSDFRRVLERKDIDAVVVATPDHWHAFIAIQACAAGKDVYVEKPISTSVREGRLMVEAARKHNRVMQVGIQQRSGLHFQRAVELVQSGAIGKVVYAEAWNHGHGPANSAGAPPNEQPPAELDWNMWLGPAPASDYRPGVHPGRWRVFYDYGGGNLADWGVHLIDVIQWAMKVDAPLSAQAVGGAYWMRDGRDTPDTVNVIYEYPGFMVNYTHMNQCNYGRGGKFYGIIFHGSDAALVLDRSGYEMYPVTTKHVIPTGEANRGAFDDMLGTGTYFSSQRAAEWGTTSLQHVPHVANFLACMRSRQLPAGDIETGFHATLPCHLGNIAYRAGSKVTWDPKTERITNNTQANRLLTRQYRAPWRLPGLDS
jgi:predicted dehydrogenase